MNRKVKRASLIVGIFAVAVGGAFGLGKMKPPPETKDMAKVDPLVEVLPLEEISASGQRLAQGVQMLGECFDHFVCGSRNEIGFAFGNPIRAHRTIVGEDQASNTEEAIR